MFHTALSKATLMRRLSPREIALLIPRQIAQA
jgi:hypothetical protein